MPIYSFLSGPMKKTSKVGYGYRNQVVEAIRVCHDLAARYDQLESPRGYASLVSDFALPLTLRRAIGLLERLTEAAMKTTTTTDNTTDCLVRSFLNTLEDYPDLKERYPTHIFEMGRKTKLNNLACSECKRHRRRTVGISVGQRACLEDLTVSGRQCRRCVLGSDHRARADYQQ